MNTTLEHENDTPLLLNWTKEKEKTFSANQLIGAYEAGVEQGMSEKERIIKKQFDENLQKAQKESENIVKKITENFKISFSAIHLKAESVSKFTSLIIIDFDTYVSEDMNEINDFVLKFEDRVNNEDFIINFMFTYYDKKLNREAIISDGFFLRYDG